MSRVLPLPFAFSSSSFSSTHPFHNSVNRFLLVHFHARANFLDPFCPILTAPPPRPFRKISRPFKYPGKMHLHSFVRIISSQRTNERTSSLAYESLMLFLFSYSFSSRMHFCIPVFNIPFNILRLYLLFLVFICGQLLCLKKNDSFSIREFRNDRMNYFE